MKTSSRFICDDSSTGQLVELRGGYDNHSERNVPVIAAQTRSIRSAALRYQVGCRTVLRLQAVEAAEEFEAAFRRSQSGRTAAHIRKKFPLAIQLQNERISVTPRRKLGSSGTRRGGGLSACKCTLRGLFVLASGAKEGGRHMITFKCTECGSMLRGGDDKAGRKARCPKCNNLTQIPGPHEQEVTGSTLPQEASPLQQLAGAVTQAGYGQAPLGTFPEAPPDLRPGASLEPPKELQVDNSFLGVVAGPLPTPASFIDRGLNALRKPSIEDALRTGERIGFSAAAYGLVLLVPVYLILAVACLASDSKRFLFLFSRNEMAGLLFVGGISLLLCQYVIAKIRLASIKVIQNSTTQVSSSHILDCFSVLGFLGSLAAFSLSLYYLVKSHSLPQDVSVAMTGAGMAIVLVLAAAVALHPGVVAVRVKAGGRAGSEAMGLFSFVFKLLLWMAPVHLAATVIGSYILLIWALVESLQIDSVEPVASVGWGLLWQLTLWACGYLFLYLMFLGYHMVIDFVHAVFQISANTAVTAGTVDEDE